MKKFVGILVFVCLLNFPFVNAKILESKIESISMSGVGECFSVWRFVYHGALAAGATTGEALDLASIAFNQCVAQNQ